MADLSPFFLASRDASQQAREAAAGADALARFGYGGALPAAPAEPASGAVAVQTDASAIDTSKVPGQRPRLGPAPEPEGALKLQDAPTPEQVPHPGEGAASAADVSQRVPNSDALNLLTHYIAGTDNPEQFRQQMIDAFRKDPREFGTGLQQLLSTAGLAMPVVNSLMTLTRDELTRAGAPDWLITAGEFLAGALVPSRLAMGTAVGAAGKIARPAARLGAAAVEGASRRPVASGLDLANRLATDLERAGGFSYSVRYGQPIAQKEGFAVSIAPELERTIQGKARPEDIAAYLKDNRKVLDDSRAAFGGWYDAAQDRTHLDISVGVPSAEEAHSLGREVGQPTVRDLSTGESVPVPPGAGGPITDEAAKTALKTDIDVQAASAIANSGRVSEQGAIDLGVGLPPIEQRLARGQDLGAATFTPAAKASAPTGLQGLIETAGARFDGISAGLENEPMVWFTDPKTGSTLMLPQSEATAENIALHLAESRKAWGVDEPAPGFVRLYRGEGTKKGGPIWQDPAMNELAGRWFTTDKEAALNYKQTANIIDKEEFQTLSGQLLQVDVPKAVFEASRVQGNPALEKFTYTFLPSKDEYVLPPEWASKATRIGGSAGAGIAVSKLAGDENDPYAGTVLGASIGIGTGNLKLLRDIPAELPALRAGGRLANALAAAGAARLARGGLKGWQDSMIREYGQQIAPHLDQILARSKEIASNGLSGLKKDLIPLEGAFPFWREAEGRRDWYGSTAVLKQTFGPDADLLARLIAATSPQTNVEQNISAALGVYKVLKTEPESAWKSIIAKDNPEITKLFGISGENTVPNVWRAIRGEDLSGNKVNDFAQALLGNQSVFTVDRHMVGLIAPEAPAATAKFLNDAEYSLFADWGKEFAKNIGETPRFTQQRLWVGYRLAEEFNPERLAVHRGLVGETGSDPIFESLAQAAKDRGILDLVPKASFLDDAGRTRAGVALVLGRAAVGALTGGMFGETTEDRLRNALIGAGAVGIAPTVIAKASRWLVEHAPAARNLVRKPTDQYPPEVHQQLDALFMHYDADLIQARRGVRPHALAWDEANQMIQDGRIDLDTVRAAFPGMTMNDAEAGAFIKTVATYGGEVQAFASGLQGTVRAGKPLAPEQIDGFLTRLYTMREFLPKQAGVVAETGRTLSFMNEPTSGLNQYLAQWHGVFSDPVNGLRPEKLIDAIAGFTSPEQHAALARASREPGFADMAVEFIYGVMLGPAVLTVKSVADLIGLAYMPIERTGMAFAGAANRALGREAEKTTAWSEPFAGIYGYVQALPMAFKNAQKAFLTGERTIGGGTPIEGLKTGPLSGITSQYLEQSIIGKLAETTVPLAIGAGFYAAGTDAASSALIAASLHPRAWNLVPRGMAGVTELTKTMQFEASKWMSAVRRAQGVPENLREQVLAETVQNPGFSVKADAERLANEWTYSTPSPAVDKINDWSQQDIPGPYRVFLKSVVPFLNVPVNLVKMAAQRTPGLQQLHATWWDDLTTPGVRQDKAEAQLVMGTAWLASVSAFAAQGGIVGSGPADPNLLREWLSLGNQEYSVRFGNKTFGINRIHPWGLMASTIADWSAISAHIDDATNDQIAAALLMVVSKDMMSTSYLQGASNFLDAITNKDPNRAYHWLYNYETTPVPTVVRRMRDIQDPYMREVRSLVDAAMNTVPEFSKNLAPRKNIFADPITKHEPIGYGADFLNIFKMKTVKDDPAVQAVLDNRISTAMPAWSIYGSSAKQFSLDPQRESVGVPLTHALRDELIDLMGKPLKRAWLDYVRSKDYDSNNLGPDSQNALVFRTLHQKFAHAALAQLVDKHPELLKGLEDALTRRAQAVSQPLAPRPPAEGPSVLQRLQGVGAPAPVQQGVTP